MAQIDSELDPLRPDLVEDPDATPQRALDLAHHGDPPGFFVEIPYAIAVLTRNRTLRQKLPMLRRVRDEAEADLTVSTLELGRALHEGREHERARELGTALRIANARHRQSSQYQEELAQARSEAEETISTLEASVARTGEKVRPLRTRANDLQAQIVVFQRGFEAVSSNINEATVELASLSKDDANRRIELEASRTNQRVDADAALAEIEARTPELGELEAEIAEIEKSSNEARALIETTGASLEATKSRIKIESADANDAFDKACVELANEAVRLRIDHRIAPAAARRARLHYDTHLGHVLEHDNHELALTLHYPTSLRRGLVELGLLTCIGLGFTFHVLFG